jgi:hypothetical protein
MFSKAPNACWVRLGNAYRTSSSSIGETTSGSRTLISSHSSANCPTVSGCSKSGVKSAIFVKILPSTRAPAAPWLRLLSGIVLTNMHLFASR